MRTTLDIDDGLIEALQARHPDVTKTEAIEIAIREYLRRDATRRLRELAGHAQFEDVSPEMRSRDRSS